jgi:hypothetical protein
MKSISGLALLFAFSIASILKVLTLPHIHIPLDHLHPLHGDLLTHWQ